MSKILDVLIIGAGVSGIGMASRLAMHCPDKSFAILERRKRIGGTWDLFRYPGIRSDSDMYTFGFNFRPWASYKTLADGPSIREYLADTAQHFDVQDKIHFNLKTESANWSSQDNCWTVTTHNEATGESEIFRARFMVAATGYYNYDAGYKPSFENESDFKGQIIHPQHWPENLDYQDKKVVIIGSGATAVTLVPFMVDKAAHVTMLQRSPTYIFAIPAFDKLSALLGKVLPASLNYRLARRRNLFIWRKMYKACKRFPNLTRRFIINQAKKQVGEQFREKDFSPNYAPWDQRLCAAPDGDLFKAIKSGRASIETGKISRFTETGILLESGEELKADIIISATGLNLQMLGGMQISVDDEEKILSKKMLYKGALIEDLPNMSWVIGYVNLSWTMKADLTSEYVCRLLQHMDENGYTVARPVDHDNCRINESVLGALNAGYVNRADSTLPRQGNKAPWQVLHKYEEDREIMLSQPISDGILQFSADQKPKAKVIPLVKAA